MGNKDKTRDGDATATSTEANRDHSQDQGARDTALARTITEAVARETQYQEAMKKNCATALLTTLKVTSGSDGFRVMDPFDWTMDKNIYQMATLVTQN